MSLLLVRHASAGKGDEWKAADAERPLDERGEEQAAHLPDVLSRFPIERILSSPGEALPRHGRPTRRRAGTDGRAA